MTTEEKQEIVKSVLTEINKPVTLPIEILDETVRPFYAHPTDAGMDLRAREDIEIPPMETRIIPAGIKTAIPEGYMIYICPRSGLNAKTPLRANLGTIDSGYRGEYGVIMTNYSPIDTKDEICTLEDKHKFGTYKIKKGDRIAQIVMFKYSQMSLQEVEDITTIEGNRGGGFGSTGTK